MKRTVGLLCLLFFLNSTAFASSADSIKAGLATVKNEEQRLKLLLSFCEENKSYAYDTFFKYADQAFLLAQKVGEPEQVILAKYYAALQFYRKQKLDTVQQIIGATLQKIASPKHAFLANKFKLLKGSTLVRQNHQKEAIQVFYEVITAAEHAHDSISYVSALNAQGWAQMELGVFPMAKMWLFKAVNSATANGVVSKNTVMYANLASCYGAMGQLDSAKHYIEMAIALAQKYNDLSVEANGYNLLSSYYLDLKEYPKSLAALQKSSEIRKVIGDPYFIISDMAQTAHLLAKMGKFQDAKDVIDEAMIIAKDGKLEAKLPLLYLVLSQNLYDAKDYKGTADALFTLQKLQDSLYHKASVQELAEMQVKYETSKQEQIIQQQQFELVKKNYFLYGSLILILLTIVLGIVVLRNRKHRQEVKMQKLILQQQEIATQSIVAAEENERKRIASDLHDGLGQLLTAARFNLNGIADNVTGLSTAEKLVFNKAVSLVDESCKEVRNVSHNIMPSALLKSGLGDAVKDFIDKIENKKLKVSLSTAGLNEKLDANTEILVYRIIQECVNNTIKHAGANRLDIALINDTDGLNITLEDNGTGFDTHILKEGKGIGMKNIRTRTDYLKGTLDIDTRPGKGTLIAIHIPNNLTNKP